MRPSYLWTHPISTHPIIPPRQKSERSFRNVMNVTPPRFQSDKKQVLRISMAATLALILVCFVTLVIFLLLPESQGTPGGALGGNKITEIPVSSSDAFEKGTLLLVNNNVKISIYPEEDSLLSIREHKTESYVLPSGQNLRLQQSALTALNQMMDAYYAATQDNTIRVTSAYRSEQDQAALTSSSVQAGFSDHHLGLSVALKDASGDIPAEHWLIQNCYKYGFIQRYPIGKEAFTGDTQRYTNCFRYVGIEHATYMHENNLSLEEYHDALKTQTSSDGKHFTITVNGKSYEIYYLPASLSGDSAAALTTIKIPKDATYTYSGNNMDGFIITVTK